MSTLYSEHPKMFKNQPLLFILSILLIPAFGLGILILLSWYLSTKSSKLEVDESRIKHEKGLLSKERRELSMSSVRTIRTQQSFTDRIFGVGTVEVYSAGDVPEIVVSGIPNPNFIRELVMDRQRDATERT